MSEGGAVSAEEILAASDAWEKTTGRIAYSNGIRAALEAAAKVREKQNEELLERLYGPDKGRRQGEGG